MNTERTPAFEKYTDGLLPCIIQDMDTNKVLMLGFMNEAALQKTQEQGKVTFFSRSKQRLWTKGEESGNVLLPKEFLFDCDNDTLLIKVVPAGPVCHTGADTCFGESNTSADFLVSLGKIIEDRKANATDQSYTGSLFKKGINKIAQKVGEEAVEMIIEAKEDHTELFKEEAADLLFHYMILLSAKNISLNDIKTVLQKRHQSRQA